MRHKEEAQSELRIGAINGPYYAYGYGPAVPFCTGLAPRAGRFFSQIPRQV